MSTKRKTRSKGEPASMEDELKTGVENSRKRIKTRALTRKFRALGEALFDCGGAVGKARVLLDEVLASARSETLQHLAEIQRLLNAEMEELAEKAGLPSCCICGATDDAAVRRLAEDDPTIPGFATLSDLPLIAHDHWRQCKCKQGATLCPTCFGRTRISVKSSVGGRVYDMIRCPACRSERFFEVPQVEAAIKTCDPRIVPRDEPALSHMPIVVRGNQHTPTPEATQSHCPCSPPRRQRPRSPTYRPSSPDYSPELIAEDIIAREQPDYSPLSEEERELVERRVLRIVRGTPGITRQRLEMRLGIGHIVFIYMLDSMLRRRAIRTSSDGGLHHFNESSQ